MRMRQCRLHRVTCLSGAPILMVLMMMPFWTWPMTTKGIHTLRDILRAIQVYQLIPTHIKPNIGGNTDIIVGRINRWYEIETNDTWMTYLGGSGHDESKAISFDALNDRVAIASGGFGFGSMPNIPLASNPNCFQGSGSGFIAYLNASGSQSGRVIYRTQLHQGSVFTSVDHDAAGNLYVLGHGPVFTDYPNQQAPGTYTTMFGSEEDTFTNSVLISKLTPDGDMVWATKFGGPEQDYSGRCHVDDVTQRLYITGSTHNAHAGANNCDPGTWGDFPICDAGGFHKHG